MSKRSQVIEIIRLVTLLMGGLGTATAYAQAPTFSAPGLPPIPGLSALTGANAIPAPPTAPPIVSPPKLETDRVANPANPGLSDLTSVPLAIATPGDASALKAGDALADLPAPVAPESGDVVGDIAPPPLPETSASATITPLPATTDAAPGAIAVPTAPALAGGMVIPPPPITYNAPVFAAPANDIIAPATSLPEIDVAEEAPKRKTWQTRLAPVSTAYNTRYNYRRVQLPNAIYRPAYDKENRHLPTRVTREDYVQLLFQNAATNNIDGTRALLNAGADINATNPRGETPLQVARRYGALNTTSLLQARGAR